MKTKYVLLISVLGFLGISAIKVGEDILSKLGMDAQNAQFYLMANITKSPSGEIDANEDYFKLPYAKLLPSVITGDKVGAAKELCDYIKMYCNSEEFSKEYNSRREKSKPTSEPPQIDEETLKMTREAVQSMEAELAQLKKDPKGNKQSIDAYEMMLTPQKANLAEWEDPTPNMTKWKKKFPADPAVLVKARLQDYLKLVATVDFGAQLTAPDKYNMRKFTNPKYEQMPPEWKACYRAGKEVNGVVTAFVKDWLKGEIIAANKTRMPVASASMNSTNKMESSANTTTAIGAASTAQVNDSSDQAAKPKKSLLGKMKDKAKAIIKD
jgi:hypothetical protein